MDRYSRNAMGVRRASKKSPKDLRSPLRTFTVPFCSLALCHTVMSQQAFRDRTRKYFLPPAARDLAPSGAILLGNMIANPQTPDEPINSDPPPPIPPLILLPDVAEPDWSWEREVRLSGQGSIFASFLQHIVGVGVEAGLKGDDIVKKAYSASLVTKSFSPSLEYIQTAIASPDVQEYLQSAGFFKKRLYMIVGIKIASNATIATSMMGKVGIFANVSFDATQVGAPGLEFGPKFQVSRAVRDISTSKGVPSFVFAYRLKRIALKMRKLGQDVITQSNYYKGALYSQGDGGNKHEDKAEGYLVDGIEEGDASADEFGLAALDARDESDDQLCQVVMPWAEGGLRK
jgi:hypothetical protein